MQLITLRPAYNGQKDTKETARYKWVLIETKLFNMVVNDFDAKQSASYSRVLVVTKLVLSGTQCLINTDMKYWIGPFLNLSVRLPVKILK